MTPARATFTASNLLPGRIYRVTAPFTDCDGRLHAPGETWRYTGKNFIPSDDGLTLLIEQNGQPASIRLQSRAGAQAWVIENFSDYVTLEEAAAVIQPPAAQKKPGRRGKWAGAAAGLLAALAIGLGLACLVAVGALFWFINALAYRPHSPTMVPNYITANVVAPFSVRSGSNFTLEVQVSNSSSQPLKLQAIELQTKYLDGFSVVSSDPPFTKGYKVVESSQFFRYEIAGQIPARGVLPVRFTLKPVKPGTYTGEVSVCVDAPQGCTIYFVTTVVSSP